MTVPIWAAGVEILPNGALRAALLVSDGHNLLGFGPCAAAASMVQDAGSARDLAVAADRLSKGAVAGSTQIALSTDALTQPLASLLSELTGWQLAGVLAPPELAFSGAALAEATGQGVVWGFEEAGQLWGAARGSEDAFYHHALLRWLGLGVPAVVLDLGTTARLTWADPRITDPAAPGACLAFDAGPGVAACDGALAESGEVFGDLPERLLAMEFFRRPLPRAFDAGTAAAFADLLRPLTPADAATTAAACAAAGIASALSLCPEPPSLILVTGAAQTHRAALRMIRAGTGVPLRFATELGLSAPHLRAQAAAFLAIRVKSDLTTTSSWLEGRHAAVASAYFAASCKTNH